MLGLIFGLIPRLLSAWTTWQKNKFDAQVQIIQAKTGADKETAVALAKTAAIEAHESTSRLSVIVGSRVLLWLIVGFAVPWLIYDGKVVLWDNIFDPWWYGEPGLTLAIKGQVGDWGGQIHAFIFGSSTTLALGHMYFNRKQ